MLIMTQSKMRIVYMGKGDVLEVQGNAIILLQGDRKGFVVASYSTHDRAQEVMGELLSNADAKGLILPER